MRQLFKNKTSIFLFTLLLGVNSVFAEDNGDPGGMEGGDAGNAVPIHDWIPYVLIISIAIVFYYMHKKTKAKEC